MNVLVTGGAGFIGSTLTRQLLKEKKSLEIERVVVFDAFTYAGHLENLAEMNADPLLRVIHGNVADAIQVKRVFRDESIDCVFHLAAETHVDRSIDDSSPFIRTNVEGTLQLLEAARHHWKGETAKLFLHVSTDEVYGARGLENDPPATEASPYAPRSPYAASKAASDHLALAFHYTHDLPVIVTQSSNNYGPRQYPEKLVPLMILNALEERPLPIYGDGRQIRDWIAVEDHVQGLLTALSRGCPGETYLFGSGRETINLEIVRLLCRLLDEKRPRQAGSYNDLIKHVDDRPGHDRRYAIDSGKARRELAWNPAVALEEGLAGTIDWYLANLEWCQGVTANRYNRERLGLGPT